MAQPYDMRTPAPAAPPQQSGGAGGGGGGLSAALPRLFSILQNHPDLPASFISGLIGNYGALSEQRHAAQAQRRGDFTSTLQNYAVSEGATPEMMQALGESGYPNIAGSNFGQSAMETLAGGMSGTPGPGAFTPEDQTGVAGAVAEAFQGLTPEQQKDPAKLQEIVVLAQQQAAALGKNDQGIKDAAMYARLALSRLTGQSRSDLVGSLYPMEPHLSSETTASTLGADLRESMGNLGEMATNSGSTVFARPHDPNSNWWEHFDVTPDS